MAMCCTRAFAFEISGAISESVAPVTQIVTAQNASAPEHVATQNILAKNVLARNAPAQDTNAPLVEPVNAAATPAAISAAIPDATPVRPLFNREKTALFLWIVFIGAAVTVSVWLAKSGRPIKIRRIAALEAVDNAVGRATEMGRSILFVPGIQDMDNIQTVAGLTMLGRVAKTAAEYDATIQVPTCRSLVMEAARDTVRASYLSAGRADGFSADRITYITDDQFGYVANVVGSMVREKPATCFYMGCFYAESLIFSETGNAIGAIQIAGTAESSQLPFFVAACDYTLIGEEFFAASAYLSGEPAQLGTLRGQDIGKFAVGVLITLGVLAATILAVAPSSAVISALLYGLQKVLGG
ncbi:MAG: hypothetical protein EXS12_04475 [Phycisphaerales bacterium]|nr:hypothetical protein [Phycisphaerales bacterium]